MKESLGDRNRPAADGKSSSAAAKDPLGPNSEIGRKLKQYYDGLLSEDVPDRFANLLSQLEAAEVSTPRKRD